MNDLGHTALLRAVPIVLALWVGMSSGRAQEECGAPQSKKVAKLLDKATSARGGTLRERIDLLGQAMEAEPQCAACRFAKARLEYQYASERTGDYSRAYADFERLVSDCPEIGRAHV